MQWEYVYADLQLQVTFVADSRSPFKELNANERETLNRLLYMALTNFNWLRALYLKDAIEYAKRMDKARERDNEYRGEE